MANINKRASKQVNKQLYQAESETESSLKGKPGRKKQVTKASIIPGIPEGPGEQLIPWKSKTTVTRKLPQKVTRPKTSLYADGYHFPLTNKR